MARSRQLIRLPALMQAAPWGSNTFSKATGTLYAAGLSVSGDGIRSRNTLTFPRGTQIAGNFYSNFDANQGSIVLWVKPTWAGNDGKKHVFLHWSTNGMLYKDTDNKLYFSVASGVNVSVNIAAWSAGTVYRVDLRWDADNPVSGTNRLSLSVEDSHTLGRTTDYTPETPFAGIFIGTDDEGSYSADALLEGLTVSREVWWDGAAGIDTHFGRDIVAMDYDKTTDRCDFPGSTNVYGEGSWGITCAVPTNAAAGELAEGSITLQAYSHPHSSNLLGGAAGKFGYLLDGIYTSDGLVAQGTPSVAALTEDNKIFPGGYAVTHDGAGEWIEWTLAGLAAGADYVIRAIANSDGASTPQIAVYDVTNGAEITHLNGSISSTRTTPDVLILSFELPTTARGASANCVSIKIQLKNVDAGSVVNWHQVELLPNLIDNPSVATGAGNPWIPDGWIGHQTPLAGTIAQETTKTHSSGSSIALINIADHKGVVYTANAAANVGAFYCFGGFLRKDVDDGVYGLLYFREETGRYAPPSLAGMGTNPTTFDLNYGNWCHKARTMRRVFNDTLFQNFTFFGGVPLTDGYGDDFYFFPLTAVTLTLT